MFCKKCGKEVSDDTRFCPNCGEPIAECTSQQISPESAKEESVSDVELVNNTVNDGDSLPTTSESNVNRNRICCPECGSRDLQYSSETNFSTTVKTKGYSAGKGCLGCLLTGGPLGLLCGSCGSGKSKTTVNTTTTHAWVCKNCGSKFRTKDDILADIQAKERQAKVGKICGILMLVSVAPVIIMLPLMLGFKGGFAWSLILISLVSVPFFILSYIGKNAVAALQEELAETERKMARFLDK